MLLLNSRYRKWKFIFKTLSFFFFFPPLCFQQHAQIFWSICEMFRASAHLPVKTWKILMERKSGSSGKHQNDLPLGGPCSWCHNTTHADRLQKTCFTGVSDISTTISLIDVVTDAAFTSDLWIPAVMQRKTVVPISRKTQKFPTLSVDARSFLKCTDVWELLHGDLCFNPPKRCNTHVSSQHLSVSPLSCQCWVEAAARLNCCSVKS